MNSQSNREAHRQDAIFEFVLVIGKADSKKNAKKEFIGVGRPFMVNLIFSDATWYESFRFGYKKNGLPKEAAYGKR